MLFRSIMFWRWLLVANILLTFRSKQSASIHFFKSNCTDITSDISNILLIGIKRNHLLIIDKRFWIFEIEGTLFKGLDYKVLFHKAPIKMPLEKRYIELQEENSNKEMFRKIQPSIVFGWLWAEYNMTFAYHLQGSPNNLNYFIYDISENWWHWNVQIPNQYNSLDENKLCFVSSVNPNRNRMWVLKNDIEKGQILMTRFQPVDWHYLCQMPRNKLNANGDFEVFLTSIPCSHPLKITADSQTIRKCFQSHMDIFLIGDKYVYIIAIRVALTKWSNSSFKTYQMKRKPIETFFVCELSIQAIIENNKILSILLLCLILALIGGLIYYFYEKSLETVESNDSDTNYENPKRLYHQNDKKNKK